MNTPNNTAGLVVPGETAQSETERLMEIENGRRDVRANLFLAGMVAIGAFAVLAAVGLGGSALDAGATPGASGSVSAAR